MFDEFVDEIHYNPHKTQENIASNLQCNKLAPGTPRNCKVQKVVHILSMLMPM